MLFACALASVLFSWAALPTAAVKLLNREGLARGAAAGAPDGWPHDAAAMDVAIEASMKLGSEAPLISSRPSGCTHAALRDMDPELYPMEAQHTWTGRVLDIGIPREWADLFAEGSVQLLGRRRHRTEAFVARLAAHPERQVMFKCSPADMLSTMREVHVVNLVNASRTVLGQTDGSIESVFDVRTAGEITYFLGEAGEVTLEDFMDARISRDSSGHWTRTALPLNLSIPILVDVLRACSDLEVVGLTHGNLSPENIFIANERAFVRGLASVCRCGVAGPELSCDALEDFLGGYGPLLTSPFWQPPEAWNGVPYSSGDHAWAIGMLFAYMNLGYIPTEEFLTSRHAGYQDRRAARNAVSWHFKIELVPHFSELDDDVKDVLLGLLVPLDRRWDTDTALQQIETLAKAREITVPAPRARPGLCVDRELKEVESLGNDEDIFPLPSARSRRAKSLDGFRSLGRPSWSGIMAGDKLRHGGF